MIKKIIIAEEIRSLLEKEQSLFSRADISIFTAGSNREALDMHREKRADLIISNLEMPDMGGEEFCSIIRDSDDLCGVSIIMVYSPDNTGVHRIQECRANAFIETPLKLPLLTEKSQQLLNISKREAYRAPISIKINGKYKNMPFLCHSENISATGMLFVTDRMLSSRDIIMCSFILPDSTRIVADAEIIRVVKKTTDYETHKYGIRFLNLDNNAKAMIEAFVEKTPGKK